jgi:hypothetical protein
MSEELHYKDFVGCVNDQFRVVSEHAAPVNLELIQVSEEKVTQKQQVFSILFRGPADRFIPQRTYKLMHHRLGEVDIFLVPVGQDKEGFQYQAVFNHLIELA